MRVYVSGPMTGIKDHNFPAFNEAAGRLRARGHEVVNPVDINPDPGTPWEICLRADLIEMLKCDTIALLPGWQNSRGAQFEQYVAHRVGIRIVHIEELLA